MRQIALFMVTFLVSGMALAQAPVRFILSFDDGPSFTPPQPTAHILQQLKSNPVTPDIKALFMVQTAHKKHGGSAEGQQLMRQECEEGHMLAVHSGTARGHIPHTKMGDEELAASLENGKQQIIDQCGMQSGIVRPPDWAYDERTLQAYKKADLSMLLTDVSANDGKIYGFHMSPRRRSHMNKELRLVAQALAEGKMPEDGGVTPVVVTFHDVNDYTASIMTEYIQMLVEESNKAGLPLAEPAFYTDTAAMHHAALVRAQGPGFVCDGNSRSAGLITGFFGSESDRKKGCL